MRLVSALEAGRRDLLDAIHEIREDEASARAEPNGWTVLECIEHVIIVERRYQSWIENGEPVSPKPNTDKELKLFARVRSRFTRVQSPDVFLPSGRFATLPDAAAEFRATRDDTVRLVQDRDEELYAVAADHPFFGKLNGVELIQFVDAHTRRHADQIREIHEKLQTAATVRSPR